MNPEFPGFCLTPGTRISHACQIPGTPKSSQLPCLALSFPSRLPLAFLVLIYSSWGLESPANPDPFLLSSPLLLPKLLGASSAWPPSWAPLATWSGSAHTASPVWCALSPSSSWAPPELLLAAASLPGVKFLDHPPPIQGWFALCGVLSQNLAVFTLFTFHFPQFVMTPSFVEFSLSLPGPR